MSKVIPHNIDLEYILETSYPETQRTPTFQGIYSLRQQKQTTQGAHIL